MENKDNTIKWEQVLKPYLAKYSYLKEGDVAETNLSIPLSLGAMVFSGQILIKDGTAHVNGYAQYVGTEYHVYYKTNL